MGKGVGMGMGVGEGVGDGVGEGMGEGKGEGVGVGGGGQTWQVPQLFPAEQHAPPGKLQQNIEPWKDRRFAKKKKKKKKKIVKMEWEGGRFP